MSAARTNTTIAALKAKIEKTRKTIELRKSYLEPLEKEHEEAKLRVNKAIEDKKRILKNHAARMRGMENSKKNFQKQLQNKRQNGTTTQNKKFHAQIEAKRKEIREQRKEFLKLKAKSQAGSVQANRDALSCGICLENYDNDEKLPKVLNCGHTICLVCLDSLEKSNGYLVSCPFCREKCSTRNCPTNLFTLNK
ncbi:hypothetical protein GCK72_025881 [Caenorhabditis remanei]|uniref:RING-type domain-containing protein n=1 Tax=Caenorhabditis remanei TaxID=31234 RepID=A0A6A5G3M8_CAERE|nr:hypothetical protein GCK72_025881 [Caenorhabditis remanei]KAF1749413.1 hypothetical protein GCK72_025881 [Caenorhabditis remanei]